MRGVVRVQGTYTRRHCGGSIARCDAGIAGEGEFERSIGITWAGWDATGRPALTPACLIPHSAIFQRIPVGRAITAQ